MKDFDVHFNVKVFDYVRLEANDIGHAKEQVKHWIDENQDRLMEKLRESIEDECFCDIEIMDVIEPWTNE